MVTAMSPWVDGPMKGNREVLPKHIVCEFCGMSTFKTFGARRVHREQVSNVPHQLPEQSSL